MATTDLIGGLILLALVVFLVGLMGFFAIVVLHAGWVQNRNLVREGVETEGVVVRRWVKSPRKGLPLFYIFYRYRVPTPEGEQEFTRMEQVWFFEYPRYPVGTRVRVVYRPSMPQYGLRAEKVIGRRRSTNNTAPGQL